MSVYYNDNEPFIGGWLAELVKAGELPDGDLDNASIRDIKGTDLVDYMECHFFAGIGGWPLALRLAGWPADRPVWTGSCPCQPFSAAGKRGGTSDERHLWPEFLRLIAECRPPTIFGEQVASKDGRLWLAGVRADLEALGYAVGSADLCAAGVGAPHIRQRLWWVAESKEQQSHWGGDARPRRREFTDGCSDERLAHSSSERLAGWSEQPAREECASVERSGDVGRLEHTTSDGRQQWRPESSWWGAKFRRCADGRQRRVEPSIQPLAHGVSNRVGLLRGAGNAIVPQVAEQFIRAFLDA